MTNRIIKVIVLYVAGLIVSPIALFAILFTLDSALTFNKTLNKPIEYEIVSAKQIESYLSDEIAQYRKVRKYNFSVGSIDMKIDKEHRGEALVIFVEKDHEKPILLFARLDTREMVFYKIEDYARESKLNPGIINFRDWIIDSTDALRLTEEFFSTDPDFQYNRIWLNTYSNSFIWRQGDVEEWHVYLTDDENDIRYSTHINPYSGEITSHSKAPARFP